MEISASDWIQIETEFRNLASRWAKLMAESYVGEDPTSYLALAKSASSAEAFSEQWRKSIGPGNGLDIVEELTAESRRYRKPRRLIEDAMRFTKLELRYGKPGGIRNKEDESRLHNLLWSKMPPRIKLVIDHAFYALYMAWKPTSRIIVPDNREKLLLALVDDISIFRAVKPREFEELVAYAYECLGCRVELTKQCRDYGADVLAWHSGPMGSESLIAVQVKRYAAHRKVGLKAIFELHGAVTHYHADLGHVVTTSDFSGPARRFADECRYHLVDADGFQRELQRLFR